MTACDTNRRSADDAPPADSVRQETAPPNMLENDPTVQDSDSEQLEIRVQNLQFSPAELRVKKGQRVQIMLINEGEVESSLRIELPGNAQELREPVPPAQRAGIVFTAPEKAGTYPFYSPLRNQRDRGLSGQLIVE
ncbi:cupredoxin domain-containing protein [Cesiribacter andamanensis]|uniref:cupredoxin domain-containing protein n=1 Tax=Cesiribacter andamanensis TaxID=649507 RepID=UPI00058D904E|nr:cupredoxin domain-containing protein [Cesiribacter andamanensis]